MLLTHHKLESLTRTDFNLPYPQAPFLHATRGRDGDGFVWSSIEVLLHIVQKLRMEMTNTT